ncbi:protein ALWAYS EARLY 2 isoform X2 [Musa acuminata AAA Group]|uniref:Myb-like domain-containing protein n=1 Tax=Musa acuminata subsp. malaccensis TaxID=214687 RepID=A0A804JFU1_MUSAM|nr:PREDICTED: protein ALWAYS EARLY 2-like isoform X2 [Musa acuminata subsp. malaccensis]
MASTRKLRNVNKRFAKVFEDWSEKDETPPKKSRARKRKLSDMLGSQWSKEEIERFYEAYRKYGKDWRKVAGTLRNRSSETVEALYNMNKAYLSLPEGTATVAGLIAMMTDHYNILEGSDSDRESNDVAKTYQKPQKRGRGKFRLMPKGSDGCSPDQSQYQSVSSRYGCLSLLKKKRSGDLFSGNQPRAVGKRTPRIPVSNMYSKYDKEKATCLNKQSSKSEVNAVDDEGAHVAALALAEVLQRGGSPQISRTPGSGVDHVRSSPVRSSEQKSVEQETDRSKLIIQMDDDCHEASLGSREAENGVFARDVKEGAGAVEAPKRMKKRQGKRPKTFDTENFQIDDDREACSGTEEGSSVRKIKDENDLEVRDNKAARGSNGSRKRSRQLFFGDENSALDALQTLADLSVNILLPSSAVESESSAQVKEQTNIDTDEKPDIPESLPLNYKRDKSKVSGKKERRHSAGVGSDTLSRRSSKVVKGLQRDSKVIAEMNQQACACINMTEKRKGKTFSGKIPKSEFSSESQKSELQKMEVSAEEGKRSVAKVRRVSQVSPLLRQGKFVKPPENSSSVADSGRTVTDLSKTTRLAIENQVNLLTKHRSRRKIGLQKAPAWKDFKSNDMGDNCPHKYSYAVNRIVEPKENLSHCLSSKLLRRWCMFEWFYSAIDHPWFAKSEFVEYLNHVRLGHIPRLTRVEWGVIRSSLGKPRRLSKQFLKEEREKLEQYRESVRTHYAELQAGLKEGLPTDLARPLSVGQRVIACHPKTRELHDGSVLTVERSRCRVQFDRPELGVKFVMDIDCMPLNPFDNIPETLRPQNIVINRHCNTFKDMKLEDPPKDWRTGSFDIADGRTHTSATSYQMNTLMKQAKGDTIDAIVQAKATVNQVAVAAQQAMYNQPCTLSQIQEREADIRALAELSRALDKKEALLIELRNMNEEVSEKQKDGDTIKDLDHFRKQYAMVLVQLRDANDQVASALLSLRQRNTYHGNSTPPWTRPVENAGSVGSPEPFNPSAFPNQDMGSHVREIVETSTQKARTMVDAALQAMCTLKEGEDAFTKIGQALDLTNNRNTGSGILGVHGPPNPGHSNTTNHDHPASTFDITTVHALSPKTNNSSDADLQLPSELISSCVSTLLMIQTCTERQYPPAEIAQILDSAVTSLHPYSPHNLPIYREIETCMGIIKNQILALIPTPTTAAPEITT